MADTVIIEIPCGGCARVGDYTLDLHVNSPYPRHQLIFAQTPLPGSILSAGLYSLEIIVTDPSGQQTTCTRPLIVECQTTYLNTAQTASCPAGQSGDPVTIPAGQYSRSTQEAANAAALAAAEAQLVCCEGGFVNCEVTLDDTPIAAGVISVPYSEQLVATGGIPPYQWAVVSGSLPPGLTLDPNTGIISGTPTTQGTYSFVVQVIGS